MRFSVVALTAALTSLFCEVSAAPAESDQNVVDLGYAKYQGESMPNGISHWLGIRYAAPPLGELRFQEPQDPWQEDGVQPANKHGLACLAVEDDPNNNETSEDCLFMDVYAPADATEESNYPVYVFLQGGGFAQNSNVNLNGTGLIKAADNKMVVVTFNYRVGMFGFLSGPMVEERASLNNGLKDQRKALEWVQRHIKKFGGNPDHVVIGGASAGGASVTLHLSAYGGRDEGYFVGAAAESQSFATMLTVEESEFMYNNLVVRTGCVDEDDTLQCLRNLNASYLQSHDKVTPFPGGQQAPLYMYGPTIDGDLIPDYTVRLFEEGRFIRVPTIFGDDSNEGTSFAPKNTSSYAEGDLFIQNQFTTITPKRLGQINKLYPQDPSQTFPDSGPFWRQVSTAYGEIRYICPGIYLSDFYTRYGINDVWNYHYAVQDKESEESGRGVEHTVEIHSIWGPENVQDEAPKSYYSENAPIIPVIQGYWTSFITTLDPSALRHEGTPEWKRWTSDGQTQNRIFIRTNDTHMEQVPQDQKQRCDYLHSIAINLRQ
jgi:carboxylesterase type B